MIKTCVLCSDPSRWWWTFLGRNWHEVKHVGVAELQLVCLHAREKEQDGFQVMVPVPAHISLSHERWGCGWCLVRVTNELKWGTDTFNGLLMPWSRGEGNKGVSEESNISACEQSYFGLQTYMLSCIFFNFLSFICLCFSLPENGNAFGVSFPGQLTPPAD